MQLFIIAQFANVTISNLTIQGGYSPDGNGGAFDNKGTLTIVNRTLARNGACGGCGGAIYNEGTLTVINSTFSLNGHGARPGRVDYIHCAVLVFGQCPDLICSEDAFRRLLICEGRNYICASPDFSY